MFVGGLRNLISSLRLNSTLLYTSSSVNLICLLITRDFHDDGEIILIQIIEKY